MREEIQAVLLKIKIIIFCKLSKIFAFIVPDAKAHRTGFSARMGLCVKLYGLALSFKSSANEQVIWQSLLQDNHSRAIPPNNICRKNPCRSARVLKN